MSGRYHDLARDGVPELEDRVNHLPLGLFDAPLLAPDLGHGSDVLLGDERTLLQALAWQQHVRDADQEARGLSECLPEEPHDRREGERGPVAVQNAERLGHRLDEDEVDEDESD
jgi:hypothetical protein